MDSELQAVRGKARALFDAAVAAADPARAVSDALAARPLEPVPGRHLLIAVGKAAVAMMRAAQASLPKGARPACIVVTNHENAVEDAGCRVFAAGHPVPDAHGLRAAEAVIDLARGATARDAVLFLVSGGGSALLPAPVEGLTLADKQAVNAVLLAGGLDICETNLVRQGLSRLKGGGLARLAAPAPVRTLAISDVIGDDPRAIASGPTAAPLGTRADAARLLRARGLWEALPEPARRILDGPEPPPPPPPGDIAVIASNRQSLEAAASAADGWMAEVVTDRMAGDVADVAGAIVGRARACPPGGRRVLIWGGEPTVTLRGDGKGGRNQELALRVAMDDHMPRGGWVFLSGGTDGRDGPTDAAGGIVDAGTVERIRAAGLDPAALLMRNDSYRALAAAGDLLVTGATGTNVADVMLLLRP